MGLYKRYTKTLGFSIDLRAVFLARYTKLLYSSVLPASGKLDATLDSRRDAILYCAERLAF